ncbi:MAG: HEAT repeat domain-containing protein [Planctomycetota bacterium]
MLLAASSLVLALAQAPPDAFTEARRRWAYEFLEGARATLALAKLHHDAGRLDLAQHICEEARRFFADEGFDPVYRQLFGFQKTQKPTGDLKDVLDEIQQKIDRKDLIGARQEATTALKKWPKSHELCYILGTTKDLLGQPADGEFKKALELAPSSPTVQGGIALRLLTRKKDPEAAFTAYLKTYFLDPHFDDTGPINQRIVEELGPKHSLAVVTKARDAGDFRAAISFDAYWGTERVLQTMRREWQPEYVADAVRLLAHDSSDIRRTAMQLLCEKTDASFEPTLEQLLQHQDLRVRGMALYVALARHGADAFPTAREFLASDCPLLRFDAISALLMDGRGAAIEMVRVHGQTETYEALKKMIANRGK